MGCPQGRVCGVPLKNEASNANGLRLGDRVGVMFKNKEGENPGRISNGSPKVRWGIRMQRSRGGPRGFKQPNRSLRYLKKLKTIE